ncbi:ABC transporter ATP-binding protein [bacterium]|nr:ABC transporter ATP-binding protein [bacterium]
MRLTVQDVAFGYGEGARRAASRRVADAGPDASVNEGPSDGLVLRSVSFEYASPEVMCLLGGNGAGKSTLLQCITGGLACTRGSVRIDGRPVRDLSPRELARRVAYIAQTHVPSFSYRVIDVVTMGRTARMGYFANPGEEDVDVARRQLEYLGIERLADRPYTEISGGERQLVMIAAALAQEPEALLLDEPTAHLDFGNQFKFIQLVERLRERGMGVLMTTHVPDHALLLGCKTAILAAGRIVALGPADEVVTPAALREIYGIQVNIRDVEERRICIPGSLTDPLGRAAQVG